MVHPYMKYSCVSPSAELFFVLTYFDQDSQQDYVLNKDNAQNTAQKNGKSSQNNEMALWCHNGDYYDITSDYNIL